MNENLRKKLVKDQDLLYKILKLTNTTFDTVQRWFYTNSEKLKNVDVAVAIQKHLGYESFDQLFDNEDLSESSSVMNEKAEINA